MNITSRYYLSDMPAALTEHIGGLKAGTEYKIKIVANSFWRTRSDALDRAVRHTLKHRS